MNKATAEAARQARELLDKAATTADRELHRHYTEAARLAIERAERAARA